MYGPLMVQEGRSTPNGGARNRLALGSPAQVPYLNWAPGLTTHAPGRGLPPNHA